MNLHVNNLDFDEKKFFFKHVDDRDKESFLICGMKKDEYDVMILDHKIDTLIATRDFIKSGRK